MPAWPGNLPALTELQNYNETPPNTLLVTPMDAGPPKVRQNFSAAVRYISGELILTLAQVEILDAYYVTTLAGGSLTVTTTHPRTDAAMEAMILKQPAYQLDNKGFWHATLQFVVMP